MKKIFTSVFLLGATALSKAQYNPADNNPNWVLGNEYETNLAKLPASGSLADETIPWANSFWPHIYGGIAFRWNDYYQGVPEFAKYHVEISNIKNEITELQKSIFIQNMNENRTRNVIAQINNLENEKLIKLGKKKALHQKYFFAIERPRTIADVRNMSQAELDRLSPAEKYDIYKYMISNDESYRLTLTNDVLGKTGPYREYWEGICNGWTSAALEFHEPSPLTIKRKGITLNMGSSDLKALLSYYHDAMTTNLTTQNMMMVNRVGNKCNTTFPEEAWFIKDGVEYYKVVENGKIKTYRVPPECVDTDPGAFHIVIGNMIGLQKRGFTAEAVRDQEIWNQPVYEYKSSIKRSSRIRPNATRGTVAQYKVEMEMRYANDGGRMYWINDGSDDEFYAWWNTTNGTSNYRSAHKDLEYYVDVDANNNIIGGMWLSYDRPDFIWVKKQRGFLSGNNFGVVSYMKDLQNLVELNEFTR